MNADLGLFVLRVAAGAMLLTHGIPKLQRFRETTASMRSRGLPLPPLAAVAISVIETLGAILLILGVFTQAVATVIALAMGVAILTHLRAKEPFTRMEDAALYLAIALTLAIAGGGAWTIH